MKKSVFILCAIMFCFSCTNSEQNKNIKIDEYYNADYIGVISKNICNEKCDSVSVYNIENTLKIDTTLIKKNVDKYIKKRVDINQCSGVEEVTFISRINTYDAYEEVVNSTQEFGYHRFISYAYHGDSWEGEEIDWDNLDLRIFLNECENDWLAYLLYFIYDDAQIRKINENEFAEAYIYECKMKYLDTFCNEYMTIVMNVVLDCEFNVNMLSEFKIYWGINEIDF
jgi:hypothetical protein